jgi:hypothetical protein
MNIKEELTCKLCNEIYKSPISLNCGDSLCKHHIEELVSNNSTNKLLCPICNKENLINDFDVNKLIEKLIKKELHGFEFEPKYLATLKNLKMEKEKLTSILKDPENFIYEEISELKRQVDLDRERLKKEIDDLADDLIKQLESYEKKFKEEYKSNIDFSHYNDLVQQSEKDLLEYENMLNLFSTKNETREEKYYECEDVINVLQPNIMEAKRKLFSNLSIKYENSKENIKDLFGKLIVKVSLFIN